MLHSPIFDIDERAIPIGARIVARAALLLSLMSPTSQSS
jgi:metal-dependent amidase/aminoacylase/carboxypeptidase family protein